MAKASTYVFRRRPINQIEPEFLSLDRHLHFREFLVLHLEGQDIAMIKEYPVAAVCQIEWDVFVRCTQISSVRALGGETAHRRGNRCLRPHSTYQSPVHS